MNRIIHEDSFSTTVESEHKSKYVTQVERRALYFGPDKTPLFGWLHTPRNKPISKMGMVLCPPLGIDYVNSYPVLRHLANRLAFHGIPVLRFDYSGTGNSSGYDVDPDRVTSWTSDICEARSALTRITGCEQVGLLGVRIGATLAAKVAQDTSLPCLVLWGPVANGRTYMREMRAMHLTAEGSQSNAPDKYSTIEAGGFIFTPQTASDLADLNLEMMRPQARRILLAARDDLPVAQSVPEAWSTEGVETTQCILPGFSGMLVSPHNSQYKMPIAALVQLEQWLLDTSQSAGLTSADSVKIDNNNIVSNTAGLPNYAQVRHRADSTQATIREQSFYFGENNDRFAILSKPPGDANSEAPWVILSNSGALHTAGPNRIYTLLSREIAHAGMHCVRFDFPGVGDSVVAPPAIENGTYQTSNSNEIDSLLNTLQTQYGAKKFILSGLCSGAFAAFHACLDLKQQLIIECLLFNPLTFYWEEGMSLDDPPPVSSKMQEHIQQLNLWQYYIHRMGDANSWKNLLTAKSDIKQVIRAIADRIKIELHNFSKTLRGLVSGHDVSSVEPLMRDIREIAESGRQLSCVFSVGDPGYGLLMAHAGGAVRNYQKRERLRIWFIEDANHTFTSSLSRSTFIRSVVDHLVKKYLSTKP